MKLPIPLLAIVAAGLLTACVARTSDKAPAAEAGANVGKTNSELLLDGDSTVYGLACEGCNDSVVVLLPEDDSDPITYNVLDAKRHNRVHGQLKVGDWIAVVRNPQDSTVADLVVDLDELKGTWCYVVMPQWRDADAEHILMSRSKNKAEADSLRAEYFIPREYGFSLKRQWTAQSVGYVRQASGIEDESPVVYPRLLYFTEWHILNGRLVMTSGELRKQGDNEEMAVVNNRRDTCDILYLRADSLVLGSDGEYRSYYRRSGSDEINKLAREKAEQRLRKALDLEE